MRHSFEDTFSNQEHEARYGRFVQMLENLRKSRDARAARAAALAGNYSSPKGADKFGSAGQGMLAALQEAAVAIIDPRERWKTQQRVERIVMHAAKSVASERLGGASPEGMLAMGVSREAVKMVERYQRKKTLGL